MDINLLKGLFKLGLFSSVIIVGILLIHYYHSVDSNTCVGFDCSSSPNSLIANPSGVTCAGDPCTVTECCTVGPPPPISSSEPPSEPPGICPTDHTCNPIQSPHFENYTIEYNSELNENSSCDEIREFIIDKLEEINPNTFSLRDEPGELTKYDERKKNLIYVLENSSNMRLSDGRNHSGVRFKFCCLEGEDCLIDG
tara:strand:+ start:235 stop:825 length:591 start_codon:yes stop_codon:yes gene_type:complete